MLITTVTLHRQPMFSNPAYAREAIECLYRVKRIREFLLHGFVIMPDHCHFLIRVEAPETIARVMNAYKSGLTFDLGVPRLWQRRYHIRLIFDGQAALKYVHDNPVKQGLSKTATGYPWSSASGKWIIDEFEWWQ